MNDTELLRAILLMLDTQSWNCTVRRSFDDNEGEHEDGLTELKAAVEHIVTKFSDPLEVKSWLAGWLGWHPR